MSTTEGRPMTKPIRTVLALVLVLALAVLLQMTVGWAARDVLLGIAVLLSVYAVA